ncbi:MAG: alpha-galactosidase [Candidatus Ornithospirochaeta sp.]|nr:alpha-galactosidase [Candidatus Ornithospirochaeta sp.]
MIEIKDSRLFSISTEHTSYVFQITHTGHAEHIYYGKKLRDPFSSINAIAEKHMLTPVMGTFLSEQDPDACLDDTLLEFTTEGKGDYRTPLAALSIGPDGRRLFDPRFTGYKTYRGIRRFSHSTLPQAVATEDEAETLEIAFLDKDEKVELTLYYTVFPRTDTISRRAVISNRSESSITARALGSLQLDIRERGMELTSFPGSWARERVRSTRKLSQGTVMIESRRFNSSLEENPGFILRSADGGAYIINLVYSGSHRSTITETDHGITHIVTGINPDMLSWPIEPDGAFESPEAVMTYSDEGIYSASDRMHAFIEHHIIRGLWKSRMKPLMLNTWEGTYFRYDEDKILQMAKNAKSMGLEGIVVDDGWFGTRDDSYTSLGDWYANTMKFPSGITELGNEIHRLGLLFGAWLEPEAVSERSNLYQKHPDWIIGRNAGSSALGRNELLLDYSREDVQDYMITVLTNLIDNANLDYIKWDMNRCYSDPISRNKDFDGGKLQHLYIQGVYRVLNTITRRFPSLYIETCASGGARFDLGMLSYSASIWTSDNSDPFERLRTTEGTALLYPLSVMGVSVSPSPNAMTGRYTDLETRFNSAVFGVLSYSLDPEAKGMRMVAYRQQVEFYKSYRQLFQFGRFRVQEDGNRTIWTISSPDRSVIMALYMQRSTTLNTTEEKLRIADVDENADYSIFARDHIQSDADNSIYPQEPECYTIPGDALKRAGISLSYRFSGNGYKEGMRVLGDFSSRLYIIRKKTR